MKILVVEDDPLLGQGIVDALEYQLHVVEWCTCGKTAISLAMASAFDVAILDLGLPDMDGLSVLKKIRTAGLLLPVLILTARDSTTDKVNGLDHGADDYMAKPFDLDELMARLRALLRRNIGNKSPTLIHASIEIDPAQHRVTLAGEAVTLSRHEFELLCHLVSHPGQVFSRESLIDHIYRWDEEIGSNTIEVYIHHLRKKFGKSIIKTLRGIGYQLGDVD